MTCSKYIYQLFFALPKYSKQMNISFLYEVVLEDLRVMNSLSEKNLYSYQ